LGHCEATLSELHKNQLARETATISPHLMKKNKEMKEMKKSFLVTP
jgi:hypothetical protein